VTLRFPAGAISRFHILAGALVCENDGNGKGAPLELRNRHRRCSARG
jgi:hypothetical protein